MSNSPVPVLVYCGDDINSLHMLFSRLDDEEYTSLTVPTYEALVSQMIRGLIPSVLVLDVSCPHISLQDVPQCVRELHDKKRLAIIALLPQQDASDEHIIEDCFAQGADDVIGKPLRLTSLQTAMRVWCARQKQ